MTLEERQEIEDLFFRYAQALDFGREDDLHDIFTTDAVLDSPLSGDCDEGIQEFVARKAADRATGERVSRHVITNFRMDGDGDIAHVTAYMLEFITWLKAGPQHPSPTTEFMFAGHYDCTLRRVDGRWRIGRRVYIDSRGS